MKKLGYIIRRLYRVLVMPEFVMGQDEIPVPVISRHRDYA
jgi:hypothetical protein